jgi:excisionase family DNA binding protein
MSQRFSSERVLMPTTEACKIADFSRQHIHRLLRSGSIEGIKLGHDWLVYEDSLEAYLALPRKRGPKGPHKPSSQAFTATVVRDMEHEAKNG